MDKSYEQQLTEKLNAARQRLKVGREMRALKESAPSLFEIIDTEISLAMNRAFNRDTPLAYDEYLAAHGELKMAKRIRNVIDSRESEEVQASQEVGAIESNLKQIRDDKKQK